MMAYFSVWLRHLAVAFLAHKAIANAVVWYKAVSNKFTIIYLRAAPFNITIIQIYASTSWHDEDIVLEEFYHKRQSIVDRTPHSDIPLVLMDWNAVVGNATQAYWEKVNAVTKKMADAPRICPI